jgi:hypothetical protein
MFEFVFDIILPAVQVFVGSLELFQGAAEATNIAAGALLEQATISGAVLEASNVAAGAMIETSNIAAGALLETSNLSNPVVQ